MAGGHDSAAIRAAGRNRAATPDRCRRPAPSARLPAATGFRRRRRRTCFPDSRRARCQRRWAPAGSDNPFPDGRCRSCLREIFQEVAAHMRQHAVADARGVEIVIQADFQRTADGGPGASSSRRIGGGQKLNAKRLVGIEQRLAQLRIESPAETGIGFARRRRQHRIVHRRHHQADRLVPDIAAVLRRCVPPARATRRTPAGECRHRWRSGGISRSPAALPWSGRARSGRWRRFPRSNGCCGSKAPVRRRPATALPPPDLLGQRLSDVRIACLRSGHRRDIGGVDGLHHRQGQELEIAAGQEGGAGKRAFHRARHGAGYAALSAPGRAAGHDRYAPPRPASAAPWRRSACWRRCPSPSGPACFAGPGCRHNRRPAATRHRRNRCGRRCGHPSAWSLTALTGSRCPSSEASAACCCSALRSATGGGGGSNFCGYCSCTGSSRSEKLPPTLLP